MALFGNFILRLIVILIGFTLAISAAGLFVWLGLYNEVVSRDPSLPVFEEDFLAFVVIGMGFVSTVLIGAYSYGVVAIIIVLAEAMGWKSLVANLLMGGVCSAFLALTNFGGSQGVAASDGALLVALSAGFIGGFVYWLFAGRRAGDWLGPRDARPKDAGRSKS